MQEEKEGIPLDTKLLSDAVIELNISRRSVGMYPPEHPAVRRSIERAFNNFQRMFELQASMTLGITRDTLVIGEFMLDKKNPVFAEFASCLHNRGIAAVTFSTGLSKEEIVEFNSLLTIKDPPTGQAFAELAAGKNLRHIVLLPLDISALGFVEGETRSDRSGGEVLEDVIYAVLQGRLSDGSEGLVRSIAPSDMSSLINRTMKSNDTDIAYERVLATYLKNKGEAKISKEAFAKYIKFLENLEPEIKKRFLAKGLENSQMSSADAEEYIADMDEASFEKTVRIFTENTTVIPQSLRDVMKKLSEIKKTGISSSDLLNKEVSAVHDIEIAENLAGILKEGRLERYSSELFRRELSEMLTASSLSGSTLNIQRSEFDAESIDKTSLDIMLGLLESELCSVGDSRALVSSILEYIGLFLDTGRIADIADASSLLLSRPIRIKIGPEAALLVDRFFKSDEFVAKLIDTLRLFGRKDNEGSSRLLINLRSTLINPLLDAFAGEQNAGMRKFFLSILVLLGEDVCAQAAKRLSDERSTVVCGMIYLVRECGCIKYLQAIRKLVRHEDLSIRSEALRTLLHFGAPDGLSYIKAYLQSKDVTVRMEAAGLSGEYRLREAVPFIVELIEKRDLLGEDIEEKLELVRYLGKIGHQDAVPALMKICRSKSLLNRAALDEMKLEVYRSLRRYPGGSIQPLIDLGLESKNRAIIAICERLRMESTSEGSKGNGK